MVSSPTVLFVLPYLEAGGTERHVLHLARGLRQVAEVALMSPEGSLLDDVLRLGIAYRPFPQLDKHLLAGVRQFRRALRDLLTEWRPDVVHVHAAAELALLVRTVDRSVPVVLTMHGLAVANPEANYRLAASLARLARVQRVIGVSRHEARMMIRAGFPAERVRVVHNGIPDVTEPPIDWRRRLGWPAEAPVVGAVGRLEPVKGFHVLLAAMKKLSQPAGSAWPLPPRLVVVGDGSERAALERRAAELGIADRVHFAGYIPDAHRAPGGFDVMVIPSLQEALSLACLEAMASACPVVASDVGGLPELVQDGRTGLLVPPGDADVLAAAVYQLLSDVSYARQMGEAARRVFLENFHVDRMAQRTFAVYSELLP